MQNNLSLTLNRIQRHALVCLCILLISLTSCQRNSGNEVHFHRFEQLLFNTPADQLQSELKKHQQEYNTELILLYPDEPEYMQMVQGYTTDPIVQDIYRITDSLYHDLSDVERQLSRALNQAYKLYPEMPRVNRFYTMVTGDFDNYNFRVFSNGNELCVSLDQYALPAMERYQYFGIPNHIVRLCTKEHIARDCMDCIASLNCEFPEGEATLLDHTIAMGKMLYFVEKTMPELPDTILLRYSKEQLEWMRHNTEQVWSYLIQNRLLFSTDQTLFRNLIDDAPKTNAFGEGSAPRTVAYIGWQIVRAYMKKSGATMQQLFNETDSQLILTQSVWRP